MWFGINKNIRKRQTLFLILLVVFVKAAAIPKELFDSKSSGYFSQTPFQFFTSKNFNEVMVMGNNV